MTPEGDRRIIEGEAHEIVDAPVNETPAQEIVDAAEAEVPEAEVAAQAEAPEAEVVAEAEVPEAEVVAEAPEAEVVAQAEAPMVDAATVEQTAPKKSNRALIFGTIALAAIAGAYIFNKLPFLSGLLQPAAVTGSNDTAQRVQTPARAPAGDAAAPAADTASAARTAVSPAAVVVPDSAPQRPQIVFPANGMYYLIEDDQYVQCNGRAPVTSLSDKRCVRATPARVLG